VEVLAAAGDGGGKALASAELYDPDSGMWSTTCSLNTARREHTANLLLNGTVLVAAGRGTGFVVLSSAELDTTQTATPTPTPTITPTSTPTPTLTPTTTPRATP